MLYNWAVEWSNLMLQLMWYGEVMLWRPPLWQSLLCVNGVTLLWKTSNPLTCWCVTHTTVKYSATDGDNNQIWFWSTNSNSYNKRDNSVTQNEQCQTITCIFLRLVENNKLNWVWPVQQRLGTHNEVFCYILKCINYIGPTLVKLLVFVSMTSSGLKGSSSFIVTVHAVH